jgi:Na+/H+-dicarboxylate symporter
MAFASVYKAAKLQVNTGYTAVQKTGNKLRDAFNSVSHAMLNRVTAPAVVAVGKTAEKGADVMDKVFSTGMNIVGIPAIVALLSHSLATSGLSGLASYGGYYATVFAGMAVGAAGLLGAAYAYGLRGQKLKPLLKTSTTAFSVSSSLATMPTTKQGLKEMGVSARTRNSVVPLGANFNMLGTSLYLGTTAACANVIFGGDLSLAQYLGIATTVVATAFGIPGMPASNISLLAPVLGQTGLSGAAIQKMYEMVLPGDRILDMAQTSLNVTGDMIVALDKDRALKKDRAKNIKRIRDARQKSSAPKA